MRIAYFDCFAGISGDMVLAALLDADLSLDLLKKELKKLDLKGYQIKAKKVKKQGMQATQVFISSSEAEKPRAFKEIRELIEKSQLSRPVKEMGLKIFEQLASAEAKIHGQEIEEVHFHEIGGVDSIIDILGAAIGLSALKIKQVYSSPLPLGRSLSSSKHGYIPIPAPATLEILSEVPVYGTEIDAELVTPTGAAILKTSARFGELPSMKISKVGYGAGSKDLKIPNMLRLIIGEKIAGKEDTEDIVSIISTNIDDLNPEFYDYIFNRLFKEGALDVWLTPIQMKKNRPVVTLSLLSPLDKVDQLARVIFEETSSFGMRIWQVERKKLAREMIEVETPYGQVRVKVGRLQGEVVTISPEFEDCSKLAAKVKKPIKLIYETAITNSKLQITNLK